jgi:anhydro-N-acetylmuramic acid kinase
MPQRNLRRDPPHPDSASRAAIGISIGSSCRTVRAALLEAVGRGVQIRPIVRRVTSLPLDESHAALLRKTVDRGGAELTVESLAHVRSELAELEVEAIQDLLADSALSTTRILVAGVDDPGSWCMPKSGEKAYCFSLCDAARLAEGTGISVVDAFAARDLAQGGLGGPLGALPLWILLKHPKENRLLIDLGRTTRMSLLPGDSCPLASSQVLSFDVGPGTALLDQLAAKLTGGKHAFDPGGRFAVQARRIGPLLDHWMADHTFSRTLPRWHPRGVRPDRFLNDAVRMAVDEQWSIQDILCTATHLVAESVARAVQERLPESLSIDRIVVTGGGQYNGMLLREITTRLSRAPVSRVTELGIPDDALEPACAAMLALFHVDQAPGNISSVTGAEIPRVLGRLTPGSPQNWQGLLRHMTGANPTLRPLRSALQ